MAEDIKLEPQSNRADFLESYEWLENGVAVDLTGGSIVFCARNDCGTAVINASTDDGSITITTTSFSISIPKSSFANLEGSYKVGCTITLADFTEQLFVGPWSIYDGVVPQ
jgi:hypothetical protein